MRTHIPGGYNGFVKLVEDLALLRPAEYPIYLQCLLEPMSSIGILVWVKLRGQSLICFLGLNVNDIGEHLQNVIVLSSTHHVDSFGMCSGQIFLSHLLATKWEHFCAEVLQFRVATRTHRGTSSCTEIIPNRLAAYKTEATGSTSSG